MRNILLFLSACLLLTACLEYNEKMNLNANGSGEVTFAFGINESLFKMGEGNENNIKGFDEAKIKGEFNNKRGVKVLSSRSFSQSGKRWIEFHLSFETLKDLEAASSDSTQQTFLGNISLTENSDGKMVFSRKLYKEGNIAENDSTGNTLGNGMMEMMFGQYKWNYEITLPGKIVSTNALQNDIDYSSKTVKWTISMASLSKPQLMTVTFEKPYSKLTLILMVAAAIVLIIVLLIVLIRLKNKPNIT